MSTYLVDEVNRRLQHKIHRVQGRKFKSQFDYQTAKEQNIQENRILDIYNLLNSVEETRINSKSEMSSDTLLPAIHYSADSLEIEADYYFNLLKEMKKAKGTNYTDFQY